MKKQIIASKMAEKLGSASSSANKRMKKAGIDRLSALPDSLLISILSLLSTREAIRTCVLCRRWLCLWTDLPALAFREKSSSNEKISKFLAMVHKCLLICGGNYLRRFEVSFYYNKCFASNLNTLVQFALKHKVEDVALLLEDWRHMYLLPQTMYSNSNLKCLSLQRCIMAPMKPIQWGALFSLCLERVNFHENAIEKILSGCPVLNGLYVKYCSGLNCLNVKAQSLRRLTLINCEGEDDGDEYFPEISAPFIHYAKISVYFRARCFRFTNISSLLEAHIDYEGYAPGSKLIAYAKELLQKLHHVKKLTVGCKFIRALMHLGVYERVPLSQFRLDCVELNVEFDGYNTPGIVCLLESSPNLKKLDISTSYCYFEVDLKKLDLNRDLLHLETVTITVGSDFAARVMLTLVQLLLKRAPALEKMVIEFTLFLSEYSPDDHIEIAQKLLRYPRASTKAAIVLAPVKFSC